MADSKAALLAAAAEEFALLGLRGARVQAIVKRAGVNERMIYHHFGSKEGLYKAVLADRLAALRDAWRPALERALTLAPYEGMVVMLGAFADALSRQPTLVGLLLHESLDGSQDLPLPSAETPPRELRELYERGQREGVFRKDCPVEIAYGVAMSALVGASVLARRGAVALGGHGAGPTTHTVRELALGQLLDGMTGPAPSQ
ncbi:TetR/AcrR family transcriptional regulator [Streptomyces sp. NPDC001544]|uniref:TetR/AcrR family transcriptional regulator n=1 Tax=Streptomyces sp. NPDC001544 TaxID=3364584 RepID=UPI003690BA3C